MWFNRFKNYLEFLLVGIILIAVYKTFDNFGYIIDWGKDFLALLSPFFIGFAIAYILYVPCRKIETLYGKTKIKFFVKNRRGLSITTVYVIFFASITLLMFAIIPALVKSITDFVNQLPSLVESVFRWLDSSGIDGISSEQLLSRIFEWINKFLQGFSMDNVNKYAKGVMNFGTTLFDIFMGIIISIYILADRTSLKGAFGRIYRSYVPEKIVGSIGWYGKKINEFINLYISCQLLDAVIVFVLSFIALKIINVDYAILLAVIVGLFNLIPYFGAITATVIAALITIFSKGFVSGLIVAAILVVIQQIDANLIQPKLLSGSLNVRPFWVIFGIIVGGGLFGILGIFLAVPTIALLRIIVIDVLERRKANKETT